MGGGGNGVIISTSRLKAIGTVELASVLFAQYNSRSTRLILICTSQNHKVGARAQVHSPILAQVISSNTISTFNDHSLRTKNAVNGDHIPLLQIGLGIGIDAASLVTERFLRKPIPVRTDDITTIPAISNIMQQSPSEAYKRSASQEIPCMYKNPKFQYRVYKGPPPVFVLSQTNPIHISPPPPARLDFNIIFTYTPMSPIIHVGTSSRT